MNRKFQYRCILLCSVLVTGLSLLSARLIHIQLVKRQHYATAAREKSREVELLRAPRAPILDCNEEPLAKCIPVATLIINRSHLSDPKLASFCLARVEAAKEPAWAGMDAAKRKRRVFSLRNEILASESPEVIVEKHLSYAISLLARPMGMSRDQLRAKIEDNPKKWFPVQEDIPEDLADRLREIITDNALVGLVFENSIKRWYPSPTLATHLIGYCANVDEPGDDGKPHTRLVGKFGVEAAMDEYLAGHDGWREYLRDQHGLLVPGDANSLQPPRPGLAVQLTIDMGLQAIIEEEMDAALTEFKSERAAVILMNPKTGAVLAMASRPHFNLNLKDNLDTNSFNFAIQAIYEPGSTYKIVSTSGVLNEGIATPFTSVFCHNGMYVSGSIKVPDHHPYGMLTLEGVLAKSSNVGAYKFALQLGPKRFYDYVTRYGFGKPTGILLSGESGGRVRNSGNPVDFSRASYGYALNVTPLQMTCAYSAIANGGKLLRPQIVKAVIAGDGAVVQTYPPEVVGTPIKQKVATQMRAAMEKAVEKGGTATAAAVPGFRVAGKTGTAVRMGPNNKYQDGHYVVSFVGMMPAEDPAFVCAVIIDDPKTDKVTRYGGTIAAPTFGKIAARVAAHMNLQPTEPIKSPLAATTP